MKSFIVDLWAYIFMVLGYVSVLYWIRRLSKTGFKSYIFVEVWVLMNMLFAILSLIFLDPNTSDLISTVILIYAGIRILEIVVKQINVVLFDEYRTKKAKQTYAVHSFRRLVILLLHNYVEIILWFALFYLRFYNSFDKGQENFHTVKQALGFSFNAMTTFGYASTTPIDSTGHIILFSQAGIGLIMALIVLARFIGMIPPPASLDEFGEQG